MTKLNDTKQKEKHEPSNFDEIRNRVHSKSIPKAPQKELPDLDVDPEFDDMMFGKAQENNVVLYYFFLVLKKKLFGCLFFFNKKKTNKQTNFKSTYTR